MKRKGVEKSNACLVNRDGNHPLHQNSTRLPCAAELSDISESEDSYEAKVSDIERQIEQLDDKTHPEYLKAKRKVDLWYADEKQRVQILHEHRLEKRRIQDYLTSLCEELKRRLEHDKKNIELTPSGGESGTFYDFVLGSCNILLWYVCYSTLLVDRSVITRFITVSTSLGSFNSHN
ncbi:unnamed protein product [Echinostoma caproni]|uniref:Non-specific serine/threonine protein kinase n=1 Tax=Echinostoma caproni TaxID=27848 RepID=A0A183BCC9_9TREM|nr:unnamed protein product [Echinostoma caproni]